MTVDRTLDYLQSLLPDQAERDIRDAIIGRLLDPISGYNH